MCAHALARAWQIPYHTLMDKYMLTCFVFLALIALQNSLSRILWRYYPNDSANLAHQFDYISLLSYLGVWIVFHTVCILCYWCCPSIFFKRYEHIKTEW